MVLLSGVVVLVAVVMFVLLLLSLLHFATVAVTVA